MKTKFIKPLIKKDNELIDLNGNKLKTSTYYITLELYMKNTTEINKLKTKTEIISIENPIYNSIFAYKNFGDILLDINLEKNISFFWVDLNYIYKIDNLKYFGHLMKIYRELTFKEYLKYDLNNKWLLFMYENDKLNNKKYLRALIKKEIIKK